MNKAAQQTRIAVDRAVSEGFVPHPDFAEYRMNPNTGSVDTTVNWKSEMSNWIGDKQAQFNALVVVEKDSDGNWVES